MRKVTGIVFTLVAGAFVMLTVLVDAGVELSRADTAQLILRAVLVEPTRTVLVDPELVDSVRRGEPVTVVSDRDLVAFSLQADETTIDVAVLARSLAGARAHELYYGDFPPDPGAGRTPTGLPRLLTDQLNAKRHDRLMEALGLTLPGSLIILALSSLASRHPLIGPAIALTLGRAGASIAHHVIAARVHTAPLAARTALDGAWAVPLTAFAILAAAAWTSAVIVALLWRTRSVRRASLSSI